MIRLEGVHKAFGDTHAALAGVDLEIGRGEVFGIIGRSGAGKSTLVRLLNGLERPSSGRVLIDGTDVASLSADGLRALRSRVGMIFQNFGLLWSRTVFDNVALPLRIGGASRAEIAAKVPALLERVGLSEHGAKYPAQLSGGQKQRVGIARALATNPEILLCDEATSALDPETTRNILDLLADLNRELGLTIVLITHEMEVVRQVCDRVVVLHAGRAVETGDVADVFLHPRASETQALIAEADEHADPIGFDGPVVRLTLHGKAVLDPVLTRIARDTGTDFIILDGRIGRLKNTSFGRLTLGLVGGDTERAIAALRLEGEVE
ncbi:methionine ABC transporter ATP-binding protein [Novosphingobium sp. TCA1]|uniref:methionine ABC transporter ATP-binding protein n=1 Tax=Novosphingobium sp. TCA1 TaxID=2682474 RepID=UPI001309599D|nr:ATP-binding cassette domain-containing protein [Novosphingobium sp. TCA1]GFE74559.1 methionine import ATP-binding protein MetN [Novosphingobium sp. TCA1]